MSVKQNGPHAVDVHVGQKLRELRILHGISQEGLGEAVGLTFQQIQKYERGANRISASRMYAIAKHLGVTPNYFFPEPDGNSKPEPSIEMTRQHLEMLRHFNAIKDPAIKDRFYKLLKTIAEAQPRIGAAPAE